MVLIEGSLLPTSTCDMNCRVMFDRMESPIWVSPCCRRLSTKTSLMASLRMWSLYSTNNLEKTWITNHSLGANFRIRAWRSVQTRVCRLWKNILTAFTDCGNGRELKKKERLIFRLTFPSAGARTRTWSLLVRSQTLYPVGLHPRLWPQI